jgi:hypothetical protein
MIRLLVKLALAALIANAVWRIGSEYVTHFRFRDAVREAATYEVSGRDLRQQVMALAAEFDLPLDEDALNIQQDERHILIDGTYIRPIELLPGYEYPWRFAWSVDVDPRGTPSATPANPVKPARPGKPGKPGKP